MSQDESAVVQTAATEQETKTSEALESLNDAANLVQRYARSMVSKERAHQFATQVAIMAKKDDRFKAATPESVVAAMMACVHLDLMPNTPEQLAHLIPYRIGQTDEYNIQFQVGYKGLVRLAQRSGQIRVMNMELVYEGDDFRVSLGSRRELVHNPNYDVDRTDYKKVTHAYMTADLTTGSSFFEVMTRKELDKIQNFAKASSTDTPWQKWPEAQAKKTVIKRGSKLLPSSGEDNRIAYAAQLDSWGEAGKLKFREGEIIEGEAVASEDAAASRRARIESADTKRKELDNGKFKPAPAKTKTAEQTDDKE